MTERFDTEEINRSVDLVALVSRYFPLTKSGNSYKACCPFHAEKSPSFNVYEKDGKWETHCFGCGHHADAIGFYAEINGLDCKKDFVQICTALTNGGGGNGAHPITIAPLKKAPPRITTKPPKDCLPPPFATKDGMPDPIYPYLDADGELLGYAAKYPDRLAYWTWGTRSPNDPPKWEKRGFSHSTPLYGLEQLARKRTARVIICHDERAAEAAIALFTGNPCVTWAGGDHAQADADWTPILDRADPPLLIPRNDPAGWQIMARLAVHLYSLGVTEVKRVNTDTYDDNGAVIETPQGWSLADAEGWTTASALAWAKARMETYPNPEPPKDSPPADDAPFQGENTQDGIESLADDTDATQAAKMSATPPSPLDSSRSPISDAKPTPLKALSRKQRKPRLSIVGNTVQEIDPEADTPPAFSEDALAEAFTCGPGADWRYTAAWGVWHHWDGSRWKEDIKGRSLFDARLLCRDISGEGDLTPAGRQKIATLKTARNVLSLAGSDPRHATAADEWDADPLMLGTPAGVIHLPTAKLFAPDKAQLISRQTLIAPERGPHPLWDSVLARCTGGDPTLKDYLARWAGLMLSGITKDEVFAFVHGPGGSGKSTFISVLQLILADYAKTASIEVITADGKKDSSELAELVGARLVVVNETRENSRWDEQTITTITGRDEIRARNLYQSGFRYRPQFKLCVVGNHKPQLRSVGEHIRRRLHLIEFPGIPEGERDPTLKDRLTQEFPAILAWMIDGFMAYQDGGGLGYPEQVQSAVTDYLQSEDTIGAWFEDRCTADARATTPVGEAYQSFKTWAESVGEYVPSQKRFSQRLQDRGYDRGKSGIRYFKGFSLKPLDTPRSYHDRDD